KAKAWRDRLTRESIGELLAPYFRPDVVLPRTSHLPLLPQFHADRLVQLDWDTRVIAGQVFRRILMAEEFLIRYLANVPREQSELWIDYLTTRYTTPLEGHGETLRDRVDAYLETLVRARENPKLLEGYRAAAGNLNVIQLVKGGMPDRDRYFLGFNTPYRPEILIS